MTRARLSISLLGRFQVSRADRTIGTFESDRVRALLAYLVVESKAAHDRSVLAALLWPDQPELAARTNLRHVLLNLRRTLHDDDTASPFLLTTRATIQWNPQSDTWLDTAAFLTLITACEAHTHTHARPDRCQPCQARLKEAIALYQGRFLAGVALPPSTAMEEWVSLMQERLQRSMREALAQVTCYHELCEDYAVAAQYARQQIEIEPWQEEAHRQLMRVLALAGRRSEALAHYQVLRRILATELNVEPSAETRLLLERIQLDQLRPAVTRSAEEADRVLHNLPADVNAFIGRAAECRAIHRRLDQTHCRLVTLVGPGGAGKTRLAIAAARERVDHYADGVWFVPLVGVSERAAESVDNTLATAVAGSIGLALSSAREPREQVRDHLRDKQLLLVLDNLEHLLAGVELINDILTHGPRVQILATSRQVLDLQSEWLIEIAGLPYLESEPATAEAQSAAALFEEHHRQLHARPIDTPDEYAAMRRICRLVEGLPLAIELAVSLTRHASCAAIAARIEHNLGDLATTLRDIPARHRSLRAVFDASWRQLTADEQVLLAQLSVFKGSFTLEAVAHVAQTSSVALGALQDKSCLHQLDHGRYMLHEVLRFFAAERLAEFSAVSPALALTDQRHSAYYLSLVSRQAPALGGTESQLAVQSILADLDNVRQAWQTAVERLDLAAIRGSQNALILFYRLAGLLSEGAAVLARAIDQLRAQLKRLPEPAIEIKMVLNQLYIGQCHIFRRLARYSSALEAAAEAIRLAQAVDDAAGEADAHYVAGLVLWYQADYDEAQHQAEEALQYYRQAPDLIKQSRAHNLLGGVRLELGRYPDAEDHFEEALKLSRAAADRIGEAMELANLGQLYGKQGDYSRERAYLLESLPISQHSSEPRMYAKSLCDLGFNSYLLGEYTPARDLYERSLAILRAGGDQAWEAEALIKISRLLHRLGNLTQARSECEQALTIARSIGHRDYQGAALTQLGHLAAAEHKWAEAEICYQEALGLRQTLGLHPGLIEILAGQAWIAVQQGQIEQAKVMLEAVFDDLRINPTLAGAIEPVRILLTCYHTLAHLGDERARQILDTAHCLLQAQAARITDNQLRASFLQNVPAHVEIAARWTSSQYR